MHSSRGGAGGCEGCGGSERQAGWGTFGFVCCADSETDSIRPPSFTGAKEDKDEIVMERDDKVMLRADD